MPGTVWVLDTYHSESKKKKKIPPKKSGLSSIHDPSFIYLFSKVLQFVLLSFAGIFSVLRNYLVRYSRFLVGFLDNGQILSLHNDS